MFLLLLILKYTTLQKSASSHESVRRTVQAFWFPCQKTTLLHPLSPNPLRYIFEYVCVSVCVCQCISVTHNTQTDTTQSPIRAFRPLVLAISLSAVWNGGSHHSPVTSALAVCMCVRACHACACVRACDSPTPMRRFKPLAGSITGHPHPLPPHHSPSLLGVSSLNQLWLWLA